jgi:hypothetical protein
VGDRRHVPTSLSIYIVVFKAYVFPNPKQFLPSIAVPIMDMYPFVVLFYFLGYRNRKVDIGLREDSV